MSRNRFPFFLVFFIWGNASAELLSIPENCLQQEVSPCLVRSGENQKLQSKTALFSLSVKEDTIFKVLQFSSPFKFELLQGNLIVQSNSKNAIQFTLNDVPFNSKAVFAKFSQERRLQVYDSKNFILSEYEHAAAQGQEAVIRKSEFLSKLDMIRLLSEYFSNKKTLLGYLKTIEQKWKEEFNLQTRDQTMALQRSIASIEKAEAESKAQSEKEAEELKKVRRQFFYRTFYR